RYLMGLDQPLYVQYWHFVHDLVANHDLGYSYATRQSVNHVVGAALPVTASLVLGGAILWLTLAVPTGVYAALRPRSAGARAASAVSLVGISAHPLWIGLLLSYLFGYRLGWTPITGYCTFVTHGGGPTSCGGPAEWFSHLILPWATFALLYAAL